MTITQLQAELLLKMGVDTKFSPAVNRMVLAPLTQNQFDSLVCFAYNCGPGNLQNSSLLRFLNGRNYAAAQLEFLKWNKAGGQVLRGLTRRRLAEAVNFGGLDRATLIAKCLGGVDPDKA
jgi:lysozyme